MKPSCNQAKLPPLNAPITNPAHPKIPASHGPLLGNLNRTKTKKPTPATAANAAQAAGVRRSHGETMSPAVAVKPASMRSAPPHLFCHRGQKIKNGATNNSCPLNIAPVASKQPHQNQRFLKAASAANR